MCPYRTARANNPGIVLTFVLPTEQSHLGKIEELLSGGKSSGSDGALTTMSWQPQYQHSDKQLP